jgi:hypothetical protein
MPAGRPASPSTGVMPEVAIVDIAWITATSGSSPASSRPIVSKMVSTP